MKPILFFLIFITLISCNKSQTPPENKEVVRTLKLSEENLKYTQIEPVRLIQDSDEFNAVGEVSFDEDNVVRVYPIVSGSVEKVLVSLGDYVHKGQILAMLSSTDMSVYQKDFHIARNNVDVADKNLSRAKELFSTNVISEKDLAEAQREYTNAVYEFENKKKVLELYGGTPNSPDAMFTVTAPNSGYIVERTINQGTQIRTDNSQNMFTISDLKTVWVWANVYESDLAKVKEGDSVSVTTIAYPDKVFNGKITKVGTTLDPASRVIKVRTELSNKDGLLKPEMFATVTITPTREEKIMVVPSSAIVIENNRFWVMQEIKPQEFKKTEVVTGKTVKKYTQILSGLQSSDKIVVEGNLFLQTAFNQL